MNKRFALVALLLAMVMLLSGCNLIGHDEELDGAPGGCQGQRYRGYQSGVGSLPRLSCQLLSAVLSAVLRRVDALTEDDVKAYGDAALEQMIESIVLQDKMKEFGFEPLPEEDAADVESYADSMFSFYKQMIRYQNYPDMETVEEEAERLVAATMDEATPDEATLDEATQNEAKATVTNAELDEMLTNDMTAWAIRAIISCRTRPPACSARRFARRLPRASR